MPKPGFTLGILVSLFSLCLEVSIQAQPRETKPETATISGLVTLKGEPARGVTVLLQEQRSNPAQSPRAKSDENGRFRFTGVAAGRYSISALAAGYVSPGDSDMGRWGQALNVAEGEKIENISIEIKRGGVIAGSVTDSRGRPVVEETVYLNKLDKDGKPQGNRFFPQNPEMYRTDDRGAYRIFGAPEGRYLVSVGNVQRSGSASITSSRVFFPRAYHPGVTSESEAKVVEVSEGSEATDVDITLPDPKQTCEISGRVVDADTGQPVAGIEIVIGSLTPEGRPSGSWESNGTRSAANGEFRLTGAMPGRYALLVRPDAGYAPTPRGARTEAVAEGFISEPVILNVEDDVAGVEIKVRQGASISGVAVIEGTNDPKILSKLSQANLYTYVMSGERNAQAFVGSSAGRINSDGGFRVGGLQAGKAFISVQGSQNTQGLVIARIEHNGTTMRDGIELGAGQHLTGVRVILAYGALKLRGELKIVGGARGFAFHGLTDSDYLLFARTANEESNLASAPRRVSLSGKDVTGLDLKLLPLGSISGRIVVESLPDACGEKRKIRLEEFSTTAIRDDLQKDALAFLPWRAFSSQRANEKGEFTINNVDPGHYRIRMPLTDENLYVKAITSTADVPSRRGAPATVNNISSLGLALKQGEKLTGVTLTVAEGAASLRGKVVAEKEGERLPERLRAHLIPAEPNATDEVLRYAETIVRSDSAFAFNNIAPGKYWLITRVTPVDEQVNRPATPLAWDANERAKLRREAIAAKNEIELQPCARLKDHVLRLNH